MPAHELQESMHKGDSSEKTFEEEVWVTVGRGVKADYISGDFFVVVLFRKDRILKNIIRQQFFYRQTIPTPEFDQTVYKYFRKDDKLEMLWTIPNNATCLYLPLMGADLPKEHLPLLEMVEAFKRGDLDKKHLEKEKSTARN